MPWASSAAETRIPRICSVSTSCRNSLSLSPSRHCLPCYCSRLRTTPPCSHVFVAALRRLVLCSVDRFFLDYSITMYVIDSIWRLFHPSRSKLSIDLIFHLAALYPDDKEVLTVSQITNFQTGSQGGRETSWYRNVQMCETSRRWNVHVANRPRSESSKVVAKRPDGEVAKFPWIMENAQLDTRKDRKTLFAPRNIRVAWHLLTLSAGTV